MRRQVVAAHRLLAGEQLVEHQPEGVDVDARGPGLAEVQARYQFGVETTPTQRFKKTDTLRNTDIRLDHGTPSPATKTPAAT